MEYLIILLVITFIILIFAFKKRKASRRPISVDEKKESKKRIDNSELKEDIEFLYSRLLEKQAFIQRDPYSVPLDFLTRVYQSKFDADVYQDIANDMKKYLDLKKILKVTAFERKTGDPPSNLMGTARPKDWHFYEINVWVHEKANPYHAIATLAHEITHAFLDYHGIEKEAKDENERLTDIAAIFIGFDNIFRIGRRLIEWEEHHNPFGQGPVTRHTVKIGYISEEEIEEVINLLDVYKKDYFLAIDNLKIAKSLEVEKFELAKNKLLEDLEIIQSLYNQNVVVISNLSDAMLAKFDFKNPRDKSIFIENHRKVYSLRTQEEISDIKETIHNSSPETGFHVKIQTRIDELASTIASWNYVLGKHL